MENVAQEIHDQVNALTEMDLDQLRRLYLEHFDENPGTRNRTDLIYQLAWRIQAKVFGGLSERAKQRAAELANEADLRVKCPNAFRQAVFGGKEYGKLASRKDPRLPSAGVLLHRVYKGQAYHVTVLEDGFLYDGRSFQSLSKVAREITGTAWNGFAFFRLEGEKS